MQICTSNILNINQHPRNHQAEIKRENYTPKPIYPQTSSPFLPLN